MAYTETHSVSVTKLAIRALRQPVVDSNIATIVAATINRERAARGWALDKPSFDEVTKTGSADASYNYTYSIAFTLTFTSQRNEHPQPNELQRIVAKMAKAAKAAGAPNGWTLTAVDGEPYGADDTDAEGEATHSEEVGYSTVDMPADWESFFTHLYGLGMQNLTVKRALEAGILSNWRNRFHCALVGPPACGKSDLAHSVAKAIGEENVLEFDATATTGPGAMKDLTERDVLPRVLIIEEIEKADEKQLNYLLALLDQRGEIRKTTARDQIERDAKLFCICTVNDWAAFSRMSSGALASRFTNVVGFQRPSREQLHMILKREVSAVNGNEAWIDPALDYGTAHGITDPRKLIAICLCGRDMLLTGEYQQMLEATTYNPDAYTEAGVEVPE